MSCNLSCNDVRITQACVLTMTSGQMWNFIRNASNHGRQRDGRLQLILESDGAQFRYETYLVVALNGAISVGFILLNQASEIKHLHLSKGRVGVIIIDAVLS